MRKMIISCYCLVALLLTNCGQPKTMMTSIPATRTPLSASEIIARLNQWDAENMDILMCPSRHPGIATLGQDLASLIRTLKRLEDSKIYVRWDCKTQSFETTTEENRKPLCECQ